ncbi:hypothetical protein KAR48_05350 [bacterium]|nr:hypothetical protein [bacterium]
MSDSNRENDLRSQLENASNEAEQEANTLHAAEIEKLKTATTADLEALRPKVTDPAVLDQLISVVKSATAQNENIAELKSHLEKLGSSSMQVIKQIAALL